MNWLKRLAAPRGPARPHTSPPLLRALEPRMLFDGAVVATAIEVAAAEAGTPDRPNDPVQEPAVTGAAESGARRELVFVDAQIHNRAQLLEALPAGAEVILLEADRNGLEQIADHLDGRTGIDAIHLLSHGESGAFRAGNGWIDGASLQAQSATLARIGAALSAEGDILLYGCRSGEGELGALLVGELARLTQADVAASSDNSGASGLGGNWVLETSTGSIETTAIAATAFNALLAAPTSENFDSVPLSGGYNLGNYGEPRTLNGWTFAVLGANGALDPQGFVDYTNATGDSSMANGAGDVVLRMEGFYQNTPSSQAAAVLRATDGSEFALSSIRVEVGYSMGNDYRLLGYRDGQPVAGAVQDFTAGLFGSGGNQVSVSGSAWEFIDEIRIVRPDGTADISVYIDDIVVTPAIPPNTPPVIGNLNGDSVSFTEGGSAVLLDLGGNATVTDPDSANFDGGTLRVSIIGNRVASEDVLSLVNQGTGAGQIGVSGTNVTYGGVTIGTYSGGTGNNDLVVTFNQNATPAAVQALTRSLTYANSNGFDPNTGTRTLSVVINDGDGGTSTAALVSVAVIAVNDAPSLSPANSVVGFTEGGSPVPLSPTLTIIDDGSSFQGATVSISDFRAGDLLSVGTPGSFTSSYDSATGVLTLTGPGTLAQLQTALRSVAYASASDDPTFGGTDGTRSIQFSVTDSGGLASTAVTAQVAVTAVNDAPTLSGGPFVLAATDEDSTSTGTPVSSILAGLTHADPDATGPTGIALTATSGNGTWQYSTDGLSWTGVGSVSGSAALLLSASTQLRYVPDGANGETATLSFRAWDQSSGSASTNGLRQTADASSNGGSTAFSSGVAQASLSVSAINDAPVLTPAAPSMNSLTDTQTNSVGQAVSAIIGTSVSDVDSGALRGIAITGLDAGSGTWQYSLDAGASWSDVGTVSASSALLLRSTDRVRFVPDGLTGTQASFTYHAWDRTSGSHGDKVDASSTGGSSAFSSASDTASITVIAVDDPATLTTSGGTTVFTEGNNVASTPVAIDAGLTLSDSDSPTLASATVSITGGFQAGQDLLVFGNDGNSMGNISASYNAATGVLTLTSAGATATVGQWQAALRSVTYGNTSETPDTANRTIAFVVNDGHSDSSAATKVVSVVAVNDAPIVSAPAALSVTEDLASVLTGISFSDADAGGANVVVTFSVASGALSATGGGGVSVGGSASALTLSGSVANINAFIAGGNLTFTTAANATSNVTLTVAINDGGNTGSGGAQTDSATVTLQVAAVNDAPVINAPLSIAVDEDVSTPLTGISFADVDAGSGPLTVNLSVGSGSLSASSGAGVLVAGSGSGDLTLSGSLADINAFIAAGEVRFQTALNATANVVLTVQVDDNGNTGSGGARSDSTSVTLAVVAVNDAPVNNVPSPQTVYQDGLLMFSSGNGNPISVSDVDAGGGTLRVTLTASNGLIFLNGTAGLSFTAGNGTGNSSMTFEGALADINLALNGLSFVPTPGYRGPAALQIISNDLGLSGSGGPQTDTDTVVITVRPLNPEVTSVNVDNPDGGYKVGDVISVTVSFDQIVNVDTTGGSPTLLLETGSADRQAAYVSGSGSNTLTFSYTVQAGDLSADLDYHSSGALSLNGATIRSATLEDASLDLPTPGGAQSIAGQHAIVIDGVAPTTSSVSVPADATYVAGQNLDFTVHFSETVVVDTSGGTPRIAIDLDTGGTLYASYLAGSGSSALVFRYTVQSGTLDRDGISLGANIQANGGTLRDAVGNDASLGLNGVGSTAGVLVDTLGPQVERFAAAPLAAGSTTTQFTLVFDEPVSGVDLADFRLVTSGSASAVLQSVTQVDARTYSITVAGISGSGTLAVTLDAAASGITDQHGNPLGGSPSSLALTLGQETGDPEFRANPPAGEVPVIAPLLPASPPPLSGPSPLLPPPLFEPPTLGSGLPTLGNLFLGNGGITPSFIAQVFSSDNGGDGSGSGFLGFGGGDGGVFGSSSLSSPFQGPGPTDGQVGRLFGGQGRFGGEASELREIFGAPSLGQQLREASEQDARRVAALSEALRGLAPRGQTV